MAGDDRTPGSDPVLQVGPSGLGRRTRIAIAPQAMVLVAVLLVALGALVLIEGPDSPAGVARTEPAGDLVDVASIRENGLLGAAGFAPYDEAIRSLRDHARAALRRDPKPGNLPGALPGLRDDSLDAWALALGRVAIGDKRFGRQGAAFVKAWAFSTGLDATCLETRCGGRWDGAVPAATLVLAAEVLRETGDLTAADASRVVDWSGRSYPDVELPEDHRGDAVVAARVVKAAAAADAVAIEAATTEWRSRLELVGADGSLPRGEAARDPLAEAQEALAMRAVAAVVAERRGILLWDIPNSRGATLKTAIDRLAAAWASGTTGPAPEIRASPLWEVAYAHWTEPSYLPLLRQYRARPQESPTPLAWATLATSPRTASMPTDGPAPTPSASVVPVSPPPSPQPSPLPALAVADEPVAYLTNGPIQRGQVPARIVWGDPVLPSGAAGGIRHQVELRRGEGDPQRRSAAGAGDLATFLRVGEPLAVRLRATAEGLAWGPWVDGAVADLEVFEESEADADGRWLEARSAGYSGGRVLYATARGASLTFRIEGRSVGIRGPVGPTRGRLEVLVDGRSEGLVDLRARIFEPARVLFMRSWSESGAHRIELRAAPVSGRTVVAVDALLVLP